MFPLCRSITGDGLRETLRLVGPRRAARDRRDADRNAGARLDRPERVEHPRRPGSTGPDGTRVVDFADSNLHVLNYSAPVDAVVSLEELREHVFTHPDDPDLVPYRTSYYVERWGFCMSQRQLDALPPGDYRVVVDSTLGPGAVTYGEAVVAGSDRRRSRSHDVRVPSRRWPTTTSPGVAAARRARHARSPAQPGLRYTYRLLWAPGHDRRDLLARTEPRRPSSGSATASSSPASATPARSRTSEAAEGTPRSTRWLSHVLAATREPCPRLVPVRGRRAPVLLARVRSAGRSVLPHAGRPVPRVPLVGRRSRFRAAGVPRRELRRRCST